MEAPREQLQRGRVPEYNPYRPCYFLEQMVEAISKCLGLEPAAAREENPPAKTADIITSRALRRPRRPPLTSGRGGQINRASY
ncbi:hypothetical protein L6164_012332 [Bauhinia variegata]|uniref:Uncharacterized protein n=1 Tax=Bauhinia variegata TaxID=167791 RepID=A0ACB9PB70_BAUVA|nr:hypothetical protein L6164_012332 [Bauhinia variegata]